MNCLGLKLIFAHDLKIDMTQAVTPVRLIVHGLKIDMNRAVVPVRHTALDQRIDMSQAASLKL